MAVKDKAYDEHQRQQEQDRPKEFGLTGAMTTEEYLRFWCAKNGLKHDEETARIRMRLEAERRGLVGPRRKLP